MREEGRKEMFYLTTHSTHFILRLYGVGDMVKDHLDSERGNPLLPHGLLLPINSKDIQPKPQFCFWSKMQLRGKSIRSWCDGSSDRSFMVDPLSYFSFQPVLHDGCNKGCGMCNAVCGMMHIKEPLQLIGKSSPCGGSGFHLSLSKWSFTICPTPHNRK